MKRREQLTEAQERDLLGGRGQIRSSLPETFPREALGEKQVDPEPYKVETEGGGCEHCGAGHLWTVVGPDDVAIGQSWLNAADAHDVAEYMNMAYQAGLSAGSTKAGSTSK